jgi:hypothetical protein
VALADAQTAGEVVHPQRGGVHLGNRLLEHAAASEDGNEEGQDVHQVGRVVEQALALGQVLVDEHVLLLLQVAQAAVHELGGLGRRARREVALVHEGRAQAARRRIERHPRPRDAAADHEHVELLVGEAGEGAIAIELGHCLGISGSVSPIMSA